jgi:DNA-binding HxlR family transcriptional regulator
MLALSKRGCHNPGVPSRTMRLPVRARVAPPNAAQGSDCSVLGTLALVGDFWTLGILRCVMLDMRRYGEIQRELGVATNVLSDRLARLVDADIIERVVSREKPRRHEYQLTAAGADLRPVILALKAWGDRHLKSPPA